MFFASVIFFVFLIPFQFALHPAPGIDLASVRVLALVLFLWWSATGLLEKRVILPSPRVFFFVSGFLFISSASLLWAENAGWAVRKAAFLLSFFPLFFIFYSLFRDVSLREKVVRTLVVSATIAAVFALLQFFSQFIFGVERAFAYWVREVLPFFLGPTFGESVVSYPSLLVNISGLTVMRASGFFPDPHMAAFFFGMSLPLALFCSFRSSSTLRMYWLGCAGIIFLVDLLTFSRGGYAGLIFGLGAFCFPLLFSFTSNKKHRLRIVLGVLLFLVVILLSPVGTRLLSSFSQSDGSNIERLRLWKESAGLILERPFLGVGLGNYPLAIKPTAGYREPIYAHNLFLDIALEIGLAGLFFFVSFLIYGIWSAWKKWCHNKDTFSLALFSSLVVFSVHALFETPLFSVHILPLLLMLLAASFSLSSRLTEERNWTHEEK